MKHVGDLLSSMLHSAQHQIFGTGLFETLEEDDWFTRDTPE